LAQVSKRHHTVPRFYLEGFAKNGRLGTVRLPGESRFVQSTSNASARTDFYTIPELTDGPDGPDAFEKTLGQIEGESARIFRKVLVDRVWPLRGEDRGLLTAFMAIQFLRGPNQRRNMEQIAALATQLEIGVGGREGVVAWAERTKGLTLSKEEADRLWNEVTQPGGPPIKYTALAHIQGIVKLLPIVSPHFAGRPWLLIRFTRKNLFTCDTPLALIPDRTTTSEFEGTGLQTAWGISMPLSRRVGLLLASPLPLIPHASVDEVSSGRFDRLQQPSAAYASMFNRAAVWNAREWIFHHPDDADLVPTELPEPNLAEIDTSQVPDFR